MVRGGSWWLVVVGGGWWWFVVVLGVSWWFLVVRGGSSGGSWFLHLEDTTVHLGVTQATQHHHITLPSKLEERLARLTQIARGDLLSTQGLAYFMEAVLNAAIGYQALHLPRPQDALRHARQQVTKAWAQHGGWPMSFPKDVSAASPICSDFQTFCPDWLHFGHFLCFGGIAASQLSHRIFPIYF